MWASTPTNILRIYRGAFVFAGARRRADRVVRPYREFYDFAEGVRFCEYILPGGVEPLPYGISGRFYGFALVYPYL